MPFVEEREKPLFTGQITEGQIEAVCVCLHAYVTSYPL